MLTIKKPSPCGDGFFVLKKRCVFGVSIIKIKKLSKNDKKLLTNVLMGAINELSINDKYLMFTTAAENLSPTN